MRADETHGKFDDILVMAKPEHRALCQALRELIVALDPNAIEVVWPRHGIASFGVGPRKMMQHYLYIAISASIMARRCRILRGCWKAPARRCVISSFATSRR